MSQTMESVKPSQPWRMRIACSTITWGQFRPPAGEAGGPYDGRAGYGRMLDEIREAGYAFVTAPGGRRRQRQGAPAAGAEELPSTPEEILAFLAAHELGPAPGYYSGPPYHDPANRETNVEAVRAAARHTRALGLDALFAGPTSFTPQRRATAGHYPQGNRPDSFSPQEWAEECETLNRMGEACREEGVWLALHNHAGACWETADELQHLEEGTDPALVAWGPDVGHMVWGGVDPLPWFRRHMGRVRSIHIKDMRADILERGRQERLSYEAQSRLGVFAEIGEGCVDWPALFGFWRSSGYDGTVVVETDRTSRPSARESAGASRRYLRDVVGV
jgi:sugar phosphate isomerase/epimerase